MVGIELRTLEIIVWMGVNVFGTDQELLLSLYIFIMLRFKLLNPNCRYVVLNITTVHCNLTKNISKTEFDELSFHLFTQAQLSKYI